jgi:hypothetical protein
MRAANYVTKGQIEAALRERAEVDRLITPHTQSQRQDLSWITENNRRFKPGYIHRIQVFTDWVADRATDEAKSIEQELRELAQIANGDRPAPVLVSTKNGCFYTACLVEPHGPVREREEAECGP